MINKELLLKLEYARDNVAEAADILHGLLMSVDGSIAFRDRLGLLTDSKIELERIEGDLDDVIREHA